MTKLIS
ncbi:hypothetical protein VCHENC02_2224A, partial [Vibrio harveyi]